MTFKKYILHMHLNSKPTDFYFFLMGHLKDVNY